MIFNNWALIQRVLGSHLYAHLFNHKLKPLTVPKIKLHESVEYQAPTDSDPFTKVKFWFTSQSCYTVYVF